MNSDAMRKELGKEWSPRSNSLWRKMDRIAEQMIESGKSVIYDAGRFNALKARKQINRLAAKHNAGVLIVWVKTPPEVAAERAQTRESTDEQNQFDADLTRKIIARHDRLFSPPVHGEAYVEINGTDTFEIQYKSFMAQLKVKGIEL